MLIRPLDDADRPWARELIASEWGLPVVSPSGCHDPSELPGFVAWEGEERRGLVTYRLDEDGCEIVTLNSLWEGRGVGHFLLEAVRESVARTGLRVWLITTNDNIRAIAFYQRRGMDLVRLHRNFVDVVGRHKRLPPPVPGAIPFRHALEFEFPASTARSDA